MVEVLAPCGNEKTFFSAINAGADALYLGLNDFNARKNADNFTLENIGYYIRYAHSLGVKVYLCFNTLIKDNELTNYFNAVVACHRLGADAFILQDLFLGKFINERYPDICLHLSTQAGVNNTYGAILAKKCGFSRVVLARETAIAEIKAVAQIIETEVFVQGALCSSLSGHCYMSSFIGSNSGNRGLCRQPCRKLYKYDFQNEYSYALSLSDLCLKDKVDELCRIGVKSFKIEGRMRSCQYVENAVKVFKNSINGVDSKQHFENMKTAFNRGGYTLGYAFGVDNNILSKSIASNIGKYVGRVLSIQGNVLKTEKSFESGCGFKIIRDQKEVGSAVANGNGCYLNFNGKIKCQDSVYITKDVSKDQNLSRKKLKKLIIYAEFLVGKKPMLKSEGKTVYGEVVLQKANNKPLELSELISNLKKTDVFPFEIQDVDFVTDGVFIQKSALNSLRVKLYNEIFGVDCDNNIAIDLNLPQIEKTTIRLWR